MPGVHRSSVFRVAVLVLALSPLLSACNPVTPPPLEATTGKPLIEAVEAYMVDIPGPAPKLFLTTRILDRNGALIGEIADEGRRYWVPLSRITPAVRQAIVATEDKSFYYNTGVDWTAIARAVIDNSQAGEIVGGGSTITQQLARNIAFPYERRLEQSLDRKWSEALLAEDLTRRFTKDEILEMYLNVVNFGHRAYGIEAAARTYFDKSAAHLTLAEATALVGLPEAPALFDPLVPENRELSKSRQGIVLAMMVRNKMITRELAETIFAEPLNYRSDEQKALAPHFMGYVRQQLSARYGNDAIGRLGLTITTTLDLRLQATAEEIVLKQVETLRKPHNLNNASLVALKPGTGEILAMVGSADFTNDSIDGQVNVAVSPRQPGSSIKPVLYSLAFAQGFSPADLVWDTAARFPLSNGRFYSPVNYDGRYHGGVSLRQALANSYNVPAVKLLDQVGVPNMVKMAHAMGVQGLNRPVSEYGLALALGAGEVTLLSLTDAYATLANGGRHVSPTPITEISDGAGKVTWQHQPLPVAVLDPRIAFMVTSILSDNDARTPAFGAKSPLKLTRPAAAKTGTTTDWRDNWTLGYTPSLVVGVWAGNSDGTPMKNTTGLTGAAPIWHDFMEATFARNELDAAVRRSDEPLDFVRPAGLLDVRVCKVASAKVGSGCPATLVDLLIDPKLPVTVEEPAALLENGTAKVPQGQETPTKRGVATLLCVGDDTTPPCGEPFAEVADKLAEEPEADEAQAVPIVAPSSGRAAASASIYSPGPGSVVSGSVRLLGTAFFDPREYQFYKVEYGRGGRPDDWVTMGDVHATPVANGWLETWHANSLPAGIYALRVVVVRRDGNYVTSASQIVEVRH